MKPRSAKGEMSNSVSGPPVRDSVSISPGADHRADAAADHEPGHDAGLFQHAQDADVRVAARPAAAQHHRHARARRRRLQLRQREGLGRVAGAVVEGPAEGRAGAEQRAGGQRDSSRAQAREGTAAHRRLPMK
jgi:hypothetical protein